MKTIDAMEQLKLIRDNIENPVQDFTKTGLAITALSYGIDALESVTAMKKRFVDGLEVNREGDNESDDILCPFCGSSVARNDDYREMRPKHCPDCGTKLIY